MQWWLRELLVGRAEAPRATLAGGFGFIVLSSLVALMLTNALLTGHPIREVIQTIVLPVVLFYLPGLVSFVASVLRSGLATSLVIGAIPAALFVTVAILGTILAVPGVGGGDAPLWSITVAFAATSLLSATIGFVGGALAWVGYTLVFARL